MRGLITALVGGAAAAKAASPRKLGKVTVGLKYYDNGEPYITIRSTDFAVDITQNNDMTLDIDLYK